MECNTAYIFIPPTCNSVGYPGMKSTMPVSHSVIRCTSAPAQVQRHDDDVAKEEAVERLSDLLGNILDRLQAKRRLEATASEGDRAERE